LKNILELSKSDMIDLYHQMLTIRLVEEKIEYGITRGEVQGTTHLCIGQEAVPVGISDNLSDADYVVSNHRGHGHALAKGLSPEKLLAEVMGRENGYCKGRGGTQHISCMKKGFIGTNGITGGGIPLALGAAFSIKYNKQENISVVYISDGATNQGTFHESLNMASLWSLPLLIVCENNLYGMSNPIEKSISSLPISKRAEAHGIEAATLNGMDVIEVKDKSKKYIEKIRLGGGPVFLEFLTYRFKGHSKSDPRVYRDKDEEKLWLDRCPIVTLKNLLVQEGYDELGLDELYNKLKDEINNVYSLVLESPFPSKSDIIKDVFYEKN
jgi:acetoin:2,6-dichlorophenolindophenol oxidoreductase subunit alpha